MTNDDWKIIMLSSHSLAEYMKFVASLNPFVYCSVFHIRLPADMELFEGQENQFDYYPSYYTCKLISFAFINKLFAGKFSCYLVHHYMAGFCT